mmetsp:Transcript_36476/g.88392  ORF Transcript_36476/g.88392 Transcript_36476/m.88392 type:complete len:405 (-) Transcript_36476:134-1348(-)
MASICTAAEWPQEVSNLYEPVRYLGKGGFACVLLGKSKKATKSREEAYVAIKVVDGTEDDWAYSHREADILRHLHHPNIMKVINSWEPNQYEPGAIALSYAKGPTIQALLLHGGALSTLFVRVVTAQIVDALSYMHSHAVVHRDIKPENVIVTGADLTDDSIWDNIDTVDEPDSSDNPGHWEQMRNKWKPTLIDFGFARALTPKDVSTKKFERQDDCMGNTFRRQMSAVGTEDFVAPEIIQDVHEEQHKDPRVVTDTIGHNVADYSLLVDAYSMGCNIRYMMTGCPPHTCVKDAIARQNSMLRKFMFSLISRKRKSGKEENKRQVEYRLEENLPPVVRELMTSMMDQDETKRTSIRMARRHPWLAEVLPEAEDGDGNIEYLHLVLDSATQKRKNEAEETKGEGQ